MKKSTKIITTAVALVLVMGFMVVGILAATTASATITASVSWTAEEGVVFDVMGGVCLTKEHYQENGNSLPTDSLFESLILSDLIWAADSNLYYGPCMETISVDTTTTNTEATGMQRTLNANFCDDTDDGVNNPRSIYYWYSVVDIGRIINNDGMPTINVNITKIPQSTSAIKVQYFNTSDPANNDLASNNFTDVKPTMLEPHYNMNPPILVIKLTLINPDQSLSNFDAGVGFSITKA